ncbi:isoaspartyl peptidase/L-asparaginase [Shigella flexneri]
MDGVTLKAGRRRVSRSENPAPAARPGDGSHPHVLMTGAGAEKFAVEHRMDTVSPDSFSTQEALPVLLEALYSGMTAA